MTCREQFEAKFPLPAGVAWNPETSRYVLTELHKPRVSTYEAHVERWVVWQASREALVIELPAGMVTPDGQGVSLDGIRVMEVLKAAGVKVKS